MIQISETKDSTLEEVEKSQSVRLIDILFIAPFLIWLSMNKTLSGWVRLTLFSLGIATLIYNANNYYKNDK